MERKYITKALNNLGWFRFPSFILWFFKHRNRLKSYHNKHEGEKCFILGNGPSLKKMDFSKLDGCINFGLNNIFLMYEVQHLDISYHLSINELVINQSIDNFSKLGCPSFLSYGSMYKKHDHSENFLYLYCGGPFTFSGDISWPIHEGYTVTFIALQLAYYMGFKEVYLIGVDHSFKYCGKPNEMQYLEGDDPNHFNSSYFANRLWQLPDLEASELAYHHANFFYRRDGRVIYDATIDGNLDVFPKISFEEAVAMCKSN